MAIAKSEYFNVDFMKALMKRDDFREEFKEVVLMAAANRLAVRYDYYGRSPENVYFHNRAVNSGIRRTVNRLKDLNSKYVNEEGQKKLFAGLIKGIDTPDVGKEICDELFEIALCEGFSAEFEQPGETHLS